MNERLSSRVYPTILHVLDLLDRIYGRRPGSSPDPREEFPKLKQYLGQLDSGRATKEDELVKAALVYWIDEVLVNSPWEHANHWKDYTLEREFYDSRDRAFEFFEKAKGARTLSPPDALEGFYLAVALGFQGIYRDGPVAKPAPAAGGKPAPAAKPAKPAKPAPPKRKPMDSWFGESGNEGDTSWSLPPENATPAGDDLIDDSVFQEPASGKRGLKGIDLPGTLLEWAEPVFAQIAPASLRAFSPASASDSLRDARPLLGTGSMQRSVIALVWTVLITLILAVVWIVQSFA